jgi:hypothetical protein
VTLIIVEVPIKPSVNLSFDFDSFPQYHMLNMPTTMHALDLFHSNCPCLSILSQAWHRPWVTSYPFRNKEKVCHSSNYCQTRQTTVKLVRLPFITSVEVPTHALRTLHTCIVFNAADLLIQLFYYCLRYFLCSRK